MGGDGVSGEYVLSMNCTIVPSVPVACGSVVNGSALLPGFKAIFCSTEAGRVEASTCGSIFDSTEIWVNSTVLDRGCGDCPSNARCVGFNVRCEGETDKH